MKRAILLLGSLFLVPAALAAQPAHYAYASFDLPDGWMRNDESHYGAFASPDGALTVSIVTHLGDDDAEDALEAFVKRAEADESIVERGNPQELANEPFEVWRQETTTAGKDGRTFRRLYTAADPDDVATIIVASGEVSAWAAHGDGARALLASLRLTATDAAEIGMADVGERAGEGGLDGVYAARGPRDALAAGTLAWSTAERTDILFFDPLGDVYRGPAPLYGVATFDLCDGALVWRCGRYRMEGGEIVLRWRDGTTERRAFAQTESGVRIGSVDYRVADLSGQGGPSGVYALEDAFNQGYPPATVRFLDDGKFLLEGADSLRRPAFGERRSASGRFRLAGGAMTLVYASGASEVVGFARLPADDDGAILLGGMRFTRPE